MSWKEARLFLHEVHLFVHGQCTIGDSETENGKDDAGLWRVNSVLEIEEML